MESLLSGGESSTPEATEKLNKTAELTQTNAATLLLTSRQLWKTYPPVRNDRVSHTNGPSLSLTLHSPERDDGLLTVQKSAGPGQSLVRARVQAGDSVAH